MPGTACQPEDGIWDVADGALRVSGRGPRLEPGQNARAKRESRMAEETQVNPQITDAVAQSNVKVMGEAPAMAMGNVYQSAAHSMGILFENAVAQAQQTQIMAQAATTQGVMQIYSLNTAAAAGAAEKLAQSGVADNLTGLLAVLNAFRSENQASGAPTVDVDNDNDDDDHKGE